MENQTRTAESELCAKNQVGTEHMTGVGLYRKIVDELRYLKRESLRCPWCDRVWHREVEPGTQMLRCPKCRAWAPTWKWR